MTNPPKMTNTLKSRAVHSAVATIIIAVGIILIPGLEPFETTLLVLITGAIGLALIVRFTFSNSDE